MPAVATETTANVSSALCSFVVVGLLRRQWQGSSVEADRAEFESRALPALHALRAVESVPQIALRDLDQRLPWRGGSWSHSDTPESMSRDLRLHLRLFGQDEGEVMAMSLERLTHAVLLHETQVLLLGLVSLAVASDCSFEDGASASEQIDSVLRVALEVARENEPDVVVGEICSRVAGMACDEKCDRQMSADELVVLGAWLRLHGISA
jgi:hypothetical protein